MRDGQRRQSFRPSPFICPSRMLAGSVVVGFPHNISHPPALFSPRRPRATWRRRETFPPRFPPHSGLRAPKRWRETRSPPRSPARFKGDNRDIIIAGDNDDYRIFEPSSPSRSPEGLYVTPAVNPPHGHAACAHIVRPETLWGFSASAFASAAAWPSTPMPAHHPATAQTPFSSPALVHANPRSPSSFSAPCVRALRARPLRPLSRPPASLAPASPSLPPPARPLSAPVERRKGPSGVGGLAAVEWPLVPPTPSVSFP